LEYKSTFFDPSAPEIPQPGNAEPLWFSLELNAKSPGNTEGACVGIFQIIPPEVEVHTENLEDIPDHIKKDLKFHFADDMKDVIKFAIPTLKLDIPKKGATKK